MVKATESFFLNNMVNLIESNSTFLSIKTSPSMSTASIQYNSTNIKKKGVLNQDNNTNSLNSNNSGRG